MPKRSKFSVLPTQKMLAEAFGVDVRTIRNWKARADKGERCFPFDKEGYWPFDNSRHWRKRWLLMAKGRKLHEQLIETRSWDKFNASIVLHGICPGHITDPEKRRLWNNATPREFAHPAAAAAIEGKNALHLAITKLRLAGKEPTRQQVAKTLSVSVRTLYRLCRSYGVKMSDLCPVTRRRKPLIDSGKLHDLAA